jgi:hypothetical protein
MPKLRHRVMAKRPPGPDAFTRAYIEAALWSTNDESDEGGGEPLDKNYGPEDIAPETMLAMKHDCADFQHRFGSLIEDDESKAIDKWGRWELAGHDFWLSRNGHGAGFGDGNFPKHDDELHDAAESYGDFELYVGDDGVIYASGHEPGAVNERVTEAKRGGPYIVHVITHGGPPLQHATPERFHSIRAARLHGETLSQTTPSSAEISIGDRYGNKLEILNRRSGQWHVQPSTTTQETSHPTAHLVRDFASIPALIDHARDVDGATHVLIQGRETRLYFPHGREYEEAVVYPERGYWHVPAPRDRTVGRLPPGAEAIASHMQRAAHEVSSLREPGPFSRRFHRRPR